MSDINEDPKTVLLRFSPQELDAIDRLRGGESRSGWIRELCRAGVIARAAFGDEGCVLRVRGEAREDAPETLNGGSVWASDATGERHLRAVSSDE